MDPAKRLCLKNLPPDVTKKDIADLIRKRSRAQPQYIDLGQNDDGTPRRYAHVSVEGLKGVIEAINGVPIRGFNITAEQAKPHFSFVLAEAKRKREKEDRDAAEAVQKKADELLERWNAMPSTITKENPPKSFFFGKQRYAKIASEVATASKEKFRASHGGANTVLGHIGGEGQRESAVTETGEIVGGAVGQRGGARKPFGADAKAGRFNKKRPREEAAPPAAPPPPPEPPQPTKEERKLSGLQAKLAALREKLKSAQPEKTS